MYVCNSLMARTIIVLLCILSIDTRLKYSANTPNQQYANLVINQTDPTIG